MSDITPIGHSRDSFTLYDGDALTFQHVNFNHATGWCYRAQSGDDQLVDVFEVQRQLRETGECTVHSHTAISSALTRGPMRTLSLAREAQRILALAGHFE